VPPYSLLGIAPRTEYSIASNHHAPGVHSVACWIIKDHFTLTEATRSTLDSTHRKVPWDLPFPNGLTMIMNGMCKGAFKPPHAAPALLYPCGTPCDVDSTFTLSLN